MKITAIIACAGQGKRAKFGKNKLLMSFAGKTVIEKTMETFLKSGLIDNYIIAVSEKDKEQIGKLFPFAKIVLGGNSRTESVKNALRYVEDEIVLIHDGARPFVTQDIIENCIKSVKSFGSGITVVPTSDTICIENNGIIEQYIGKNGLYDIQTPQGFLTEKIKQAYNNIKSDFNDDGEIYKNTFGSVHTCIGNKNNIKLTYPEDFDKLNNIGNYRFGSGFDCHKLSQNRKLILGGIEIPHDKGLVGHSDADVLTHAVMDAILSACGLRDIGYYFPDNDIKYKNANSMELLKQVLKIIDQKKFIVKSISATIMAEKPKLLNYIPKISENLAKCLNINKTEIGINATTLEGLGFVGREQGICVSSTAVIITL